MQKCLIMALLVMVSFNLHAEMLKLATITSEADKNVTDFYLITNNENQIDSLRYVTILPNGGIEEDVQVPSDVVMRDGVVIEERSGYDVVRLEVENFNVKTGGTIRMNYLFSALTGARSVKKIKLEKKDEVFGLFDFQNNRINQMYVKANWSRIFGIIGVSDILTSYKP